MQQPHSRHKNNMQGRVLSDIKRGFPPASRSVARLLFAERPWVLISLCWSLEPTGRPAASVLVDGARCVPYLKSRPLTWILRLSSEELAPTEQYEDRAVWSRRVKRLKELSLVSKTWHAHALHYSKLRTPLEMVRDRQMSPSILYVGSLCLFVTQR
jgi:hypothetical protein